MNINDFLIKEGCQYNIEDLLKDLSITEDPNQYESNLLKLRDLLTFSEAQSEEELKSFIRARLEVMKYINTNSCSLQQNMKDKFIIDVLLADFKASDYLHIIQNFELFKSLKPQIFYDYLSKLSFKSESEKNQIVLQFFHYLRKNLKFRKALDIAILFDIRDKHDLLILVKRLCTLKTDLYLSKEIVKHEPSIAIKAIVILIHHNYYREAIEIYKTLDLEDNHIRRQLDRHYIHSASLNFVKNADKKGYSAQQFFELLPADKRIISRSINLVIESGRYEFALLILSKLNFNNVELSYSNLVAVYDHLVKKNNFQRFFFSRHIELKNIAFIYGCQKVISCPPDEDDTFAPLTEGCYQLDIDPSRINIVDSVESIEKLDVLNDAEFIGADTEWYPFQSKIKERQTADIMQLASSSAVVILDLRSLNEEERFVKKIESVLEKKKIIGFHFKGDLDMMPEVLKKTFTEKTEIIHLEEVVAEKYPELNKKSLSAISEQIMGQKMCKRLQMSNWRIKPISKRKLHYLALDVVILLRIFKVIC